MSHTNSTPNYGLPEFLSSDKPAWMADINVAFSDIDTAMKNNADSASAANTDIGTLVQNFAPGYSNASTYDVGDVVTYNKRLYICDIAVTVPESFDNAKWSYYRVSDISDAVANVTAAENSLEGIVGSDDISAVGTSCTDAIINLNTNVTDLMSAELVATSISSGTYSQRLDSLWSAYSLLTNDERKRCFITFTGHGNGIARMVNATNIFSCSLINPANGYFYNYTYQLNSSGSKVFIAAGFTTPTDQSATSTGDVTFSLYKM